MSPSHRSLHLHEQLLLLALRDRKGTVDYRAGHHGLALGGAVLAELAIEERVRIDDDRRARVRAVAGARPTGNEILDEALRMVREHGGRRRATSWVQRFASIRKLHHRTARGLCHRGVLRANESQLLLIFSRRVYPTVDPAPERELVARLREAITGEGDIDGSLAVVLTLAHATGSLWIHFTRKELRPWKRRLKRIAGGEHVITGPTHPGIAAHNAVRAAVSATQAAAAAVVAVNAAAATAATN